MAVHSTEQTAEWDVRTERGTVVVELPDGVVLDEETSVQINKAFAEATGSVDAVRVLTLLRVDNALDSGVFDEIKKGAELAASNDIGQWAIVVEEKIKGMAFESQIDGLDTKVFEEEAAAHRWLD